MTDLRLRLLSRSHRPIELLDPLMVPQLLLHLFSLLFLLLLSPRGRWRAVFIALPGGRRWEVDVLSAFDPFELLVVVLLFLHVKYRVLDVIAKDNPLLDSTPLLLVLQ